MSEKTRKAKTKDLDPKARAKDVKGGVLCCLLGAVGYAGRVADGQRGKVRKALDPR